MGARLRWSNVFGQLHYARACPRSAWRRQDADATFWESGSARLWNRLCGNLLTFNAGFLRFGHLESQIPLSEIGPPEDNRRSDKNGRVRANNHSDYIGECEVGEHRTAEKQERKHANQSHAARKDRSTQGLVDAGVHQILNRAFSP